MTDVAYGDTNVPLSQCDRLPGSASFLPQNGLGKRMWLLNLTERFRPDNSAIATFFNRYYRCFYRGYKQTISSVSAQFQNGGIEAVAPLWPAEEATGGRCDTR